MHKLFRKKPPLWYVLRPGRPGEPHKKEGPYERSTIATMYRAGQLSGGALIWTNEKIMYNPKKPSSSRLTRMDDWCRFDELPDPTQNHILSSAQPAQQEPEVYEQQEPPPPPTVTAGGYGGTNQGSAPHVPPPGSGGGGMAYGHQQQPMAHAPYPPPGGMVQQPLSYAPYPAPGAPAAQHPATAGVPVVPQPSAPPAMGHGPGMLPPPPPPGIPPPMHQPYPGSYPAAPAPPPGYPGAQR